MPNLQLLAERVRKDAGVQESLDEAVHDVFSKMASEINNNGPHAQLKFLQEQGVDVDGLVNDLELDSLTKGA